MKTLLLALAWILVCLSSTFSQQTTVSPFDVYDVGSKHISLPPPEGFVEVFRFAKPDIKTQFQNGEDPGNEILAAYLPKTRATDLETSELRNQGFIARVSIRKTFRSRDLSADEFKRIAIEYEKNFAGQVDPNSSLMKEVEAGKIAKLTDAKQLGVFEKGDRALGMAVITTVEGRGIKIPMLITAAMVHVRERLLYVYVLKVMPSDEDIIAVRDLSKKWTDTILAANK